jgi:hypothetical protein
VPGSARACGDRPRVPHVPRWGGKCLTLEMSPGAWGRRRRRAADAIRMNRRARVNYASVLSKPLDRARFETLLVKARFGFGERPLEDLFDCEGLQFETLPRLQLESRPLSGPHALVALVRHSRVFRPHANLHGRLGRAGPRAARALAAGSRRSRLRTGGERPHLLATPGSPAAQPTSAAIAVILRRYCRPPTTRPSPLTTRGRLFVIGAAAAPRDSCRRRPEIVTERTGALDMARAVQGLARALARATWGRGPAEGRAARQRVRSAFTPSGSSAPWSRPGLGSSSQDLIRPSWTSREE